MVGGSCRDRRKSLKRVSANSQAVPCENVINLNFSKTHGHDYYLRKHATGNSLRRAALRQTPPCHASYRKHDHRYDSCLSPTA